MGKGSEPTSLSREDWSQRAAQLIARGEGDEAVFEAVYNEFALALHHGERQSVEERYLHAKALCQRWHGSVEKTKWVLAPVRWVFDGLLLRHQPETRAAAIRALSQDTSRLDEDGFDGELRMAIDAWVASDPATPDLMSMARINAIWSAVDERRGELLYRLAKAEDERWVYAMQAGMALAAMQNADRNVGSLTWKDLPDPPPCPRRRPLPCEMSADLIAQVTVKAPHGAFKSAIAGFAQHLSRKRGIRAEYPGNRPAVVWEAAARWHADVHGHIIRKSIPDHDGSISEKQVKRFFDERGDEG